MSYSYYVFVVIYLWKNLAQMNAMAFIWAKFFKVTLPSIGNKYCKVNKRDFQKNFEKESLPFGFS